MIVMLPNGFRINSLNVMNYSASGSTVTFTMVDSSTKTYVAGSSARANAIVQTIDSFAAAGLGFCDMSQGGAFS